MKPIIAISVDCESDPANERSRGKLSLNWNYAQAVADAGGIPLLVPPQADMDVIAPLIHGWLIPGGADIDASRWGEPNHPEVDLQDPARFDGESRLYHALPEAVPVLGICYGCQFLNVVRGGSLIQHIPDVSETTHTGGVLQTYAIEAESKLAEATQVSSIAGKSYHHQAIGRTGEALRITARAEDGIVEALEATDRPWLVGVQWHPERTVDTDEATQRLFGRFIEAARAYAERP